MQVEAVEDGQEADYGYPGHSYRGPYRVAGDAQGGGKALLISSGDEKDKEVLDRHRYEEAGDEQCGYRYQRREDEDRQEAQDQPRVPGAGGQRYSYGHGEESEGGDSVDDRCYRRADQEVEHWRSERPVRR